MKQILYILLVLAIALISSCSEEQENKEKFRTILNPGSDVSSGRKYYIDNEIIDNHEYIIISGYQAVAMLHNLHCRCISKDYQLDIQDNIVVLYDGNRIVDTIIPDKHFIDILTKDNQ